MTRQEATNWLESIKDRYIHGGDEGFDEKRREAIDVAIETLREFPLILMIYDMYKTQEERVMFYMDQYQENKNKLRALEEQNDSLRKTIKQEALKPEEDING